MKQIRLASKYSLLLDLCYYTLCDNQSVREADRHKQMATDDFHITSVAAFQVTSKPNYWYRRKMCDLEQQAVHIMPCHLIFLKVLSRFTFNFPLISTINITTQEKKSISIQIFFFLFLRNQFVIWPLYLP